MERNVGVLISGRGSNLQAIIDAVRRRPARRAHRARHLEPRRTRTASSARGRPASRPSCATTRRWPSREAYEAVLVEDLRARNVQLVCLAGFMRLLGATFVDAFPNRILNIHPALLPSFPGLHAQRQALEHGVRFSGATVHLVDTNLDAGPIVLQAVVPVFTDDTEDTLSARILAEEHRIYPEAIERVLGRRVAHRWTAPRVRMTRGQKQEARRAH